VGVVIPAHNEELTIESCLRATLQSLDQCRIAETWVVVVADSCHDATVSLARATLGARGGVLECSARSPGIARQLGVGALLERFGANTLSTLWIANTDADSHPTTDWIAQQLRLAEKGYCAVAGIVRVEGTKSLSSELLATVLDDYVIHQDGSHPHVHGANLGIRGDAYVDAGGWSSLRLAEDHCLWSRVRARHWRVVASASSVVNTSGRLIGRAAGGFADALRRRLELLHA
jgi:cellulose synthase/poly-beta-1,6-N-acetylglucosamine synthase-like glycosyltransferase